MGIQAASRLKSVLAPSKEQASVDYTWSNLPSRAKQLKLGDTCSDDDLVKIIDQGWIRDNGATLSINQVGLDGKLHSVQLNGPNRKALIKKIKAI